MTFIIRKTADRVTVKVQFHPYLVLGMWGMAFGMVPIMA